MNENIKRQIEDDIDKCETAMQFGANKDEYEELYARYKLIDKSIDDSIPNYVHAVGSSDYSRELNALKSVLETYIAFDSIPINLDKINENSIITSNIVTEPKEPLIFLSHKSDDKKFGHALREFIIGLGVKDNQLIYSSHQLNKIPLNKNIYDYLRENISSDVFMIILWSDKYLESPACLNEMGAAWVVQADYTNIYVPDFHFGNPKYHECAVDTRKMGAVLNGDGHCRTAMLELKDKIVNMFDLEVDESKTIFLLDEFTKKITEPSIDEIAERLAEI